MGLAPPSPEGVGATAKSPRSMCDILRITRLPPPPLAAASAEIAMEPPLPAFCAPRQKYFLSDQQNLRARQAGQTLPQL